MYSEYLPYEFHLRMVAQVGEDFKHLLDDTKDYLTGEDYRGPQQGQMTLRKSCLISLYAHDVLEDCRISYSDLKNQLGEEVADIVYAVTNDKGKNRKERAGDNYYEGIRNTPGAVFVKLCDRIANVQYGKMTKSRMFEMYKKENDEFIRQLGYDINEYNVYGDMFHYLNNLFRD